MKLARGEIRGFFVLSGIVILCGNKFSTMRILLMILGLVAYGAAASGQHVLITKDTTYVASGITARGASIELYEFDSTSMKPIMVGKIMPEERVQLIVFASGKSKRRFEDRYSREGVSKIVLNPLPEWLVEELRTSRNLDPEVIQKRLSKKVDADQFANGAALNMKQAGEDLIVFKKRNYQAAGLVVVTGLTAAVLAPFIALEAVVVISSVSGLVSLGLWYDGMEHAGKAGKRLKRAGELLDDQPQF